MIDFINLIVGCILTFILGLVFHSSYLHAKEKYGWKFPWDHDEDDGLCDIFGGSTPRNIPMCDACYRWIRGE